MRHDFKELVIKAQQDIESRLDDLWSELPDDDDYLYWNYVDEFLTDGTMVGEISTKNGKAGFMVYHREAGCEPHQWFDIEDLFLKPRFDWLNDATAYRSFSKVMRELADKLDKAADDIE